MPELIINELVITANGPAIKGVCVAERMEAVSRNFSLGYGPDTAGIERSMARVFAVQVQTLLLVRVSRYNVFGEQNASQGTLSFIESRCAVWICQVVIYCLESREQIAKTVTNKLPLLSVLGVRSNLFESWCKTVPVGLI